MAGRGRVEDGVGVGARQRASVGLRHRRHRGVTGHRSDVLVHVVLEDVKGFIRTSETRVFGHCGRVDERKVDSTAKQFVVDEIERSFGVSEAGEGIDEGQDGAVGCGQMPSATGT